MGKLSEKYIAGLLDSDGSIQVMWRALDRANTNPAVQRGYLSLEWTQLTSNDEVLYRVQESVGGAISTREQTKSTTLRLFGAPAVMLLNRIRKFLVIKRHYAEVVLEIIGKPVDKVVAVAYLKAQRKVKGKIPNYPSRKWLAGYFDGDGCFSCRVTKQGGGQVVAEMVSSAYDSEGIELLSKVFGGSINKRETPTNTLTRWTLTMPASKAKSFIGYFASELVTKREQAYFILGCAEMGHFRDGKSISAILKDLKTQPHRLSEPKIDVVKLVDRIKDIETNAERSKKDFETAGGCRCGSDVYYATGVCRKCYDKQRWSKR